MPVKNRQTIFFFQNVAFLLAVIGIEMKYAICSTILTNNSSLHNFIQYCKQFKNFQII